MLLYTKFNGRLDCVNEHVKLQKNVNSVLHRRSLLSMLLYIMYSNSYTKYTVMDGTGALGL